MKTKLLEIYRKFQLLLIITLGTLPFILVLTGHKGASLLPMVWLFPAGYILLSLAVFQIPGKWRLTCGILLSLGALAMSIFLPKPHELFAAILGTVFYIVLFLWTLPMAAWASGQEIPGLWVTAGVIFHLGGQAYVHMDRVSGEGKLDPVSGWILAALFVFVFLTMLSMNRKSLLQAAGKRQKASVAMGNKNKVMTLLLFAVSMLAAAAPSLWRWIKAAIKWVWNKLLDLVELLAGETEGGISDAAPSEPAVFSMLGGGEPSPFALLMEKVIIVIGMLLAALIIGYLLLRFFRFLRRILRSLFAMLGRYAVNASADYEEEVTDTRERDPVYTRVRQYFAHRISIQEERAMAPKERIRYRYRRLSLRHGEWFAGSTARENLPAELAEIYERARYSDAAPTAEEAAQFAEKVRRL